MDDQFGLSKILLGVGILVAIIIVIVVGLQISTQASDTLPTITDTGNFETTVLPSTSYSLADIGDSGVGYGVTSVGEISAVNRSWINFDRSGDFVNTTTKEILSGYTNLTICANVKTADFTIQSTNTVFSDRLDDNDTYWTMFGIRDDSTLTKRGRVYFGCKNDTTESNNPTYNESGDRFNSGVWGVVCAVGDTHSNRAYIGATLQFQNTTLPCGSRNIQPNFDALIGTYYSQTTSYSFNGDIDYVYVWNRTLDLNEIQGVTYGYYLNTSSLTSIDYEDVDQFNQMNYSASVIDNETANIYNWSIMKIRELGNVVYNATGLEDYVLTFTVRNNTAYQDNETYIFWANSSTGDIGDWTVQGLVNITRASEDPYLVHNGSHWILYVEDKEVLPFRNMTAWTTSDYNLNGTWSDPYFFFDTNGTTWEATDVSSPVVWNESPTEWFMVYEGRNGSTNIGNFGLATSNNPLTNWTRYDDTNPIFQKRNTWDMSGVVPDDMIKVNDIYYFFYHGRNDVGYWQGGMAYTDNVSNYSAYHLADYPLTTQHGSASWYKDGTNRLLQNNDGFNTPFGQVTETYINLTNMAKAEIIDFDVNTSEMTLRYDFNEGNGTTTYDKTSLRNNGTIEGNATWQNNGLFRALEGDEYNLTGNSIEFIQLDYEELNGTYLFTADSELKTSYKSLTESIADNSTLIGVLFLVLVAGVIITILIRGFAGGNRV